MRKMIATVLIITVLISPARGRADMFGGDVVVLGQILANAIQQLAQLRQIMNSGQDTLGLMRDINRGINDSLQLMQTTGLINDPGVYREWSQVQQALDAMNVIYGVAVPSADHKSQVDTDQSVAEAVTLNNSVYDYTRQVDAIGESIKLFSHDVSPGGAQKLTAQTMGVMLHVLNQGLRVQSTGLKLQAQSLALENKKEKAQTASFLSNAKSLSTEMKKPRDYYRTPRF
ncbi:hypothetical protein BH10BDE1_BH10BDE1_28060 [soil metagenome]